MKVTAVKLPARVGDLWRRGAFTDWATAGRSDVARFVRPSVPPRSSSALWNDQGVNVANAKHAQKWRERFIEAAIVTLLQCIYVAIAHVLRNVAPIGDIV